MFFLSYSVFNIFLDTLRKHLQKATISITMSVCLSVCLHGAVCLSVDRFSWNFILGFLLKFFCLFWFLLKSGKNNKHCTWRPTYIYVIVLFSGARCVFHDVWTMTKWTFSDLKITTKIFSVLCEVRVETE